MASPQLENGYIKIANDIWDALLRFNINGESRRVLDFIIRKTYGFNKLWDEISLSQFMKATKINRRNIQRCIKKLKTMNLIAVKQTPLGSARYCFNKDFEKWEGAVKQTLASKRVKGGVKIGKKGAVKQTHTKDNNKIQYTKDIVRQKIIYLFCFLYLYKLNQKENRQILDYFNKITNSRYSYTKKNLELIQARKNEGWGIDDFKYVIDIKFNEWKDDFKMNKFLRPLTLFGTKFESYRNQKIAPKKKTFLEICNEEERKG